jgi:aryl-alcohol dehydrogenase-like predicted oxidoreductase
MSLLKRPLGYSDLKVTVVGLGTWQFSESWGVTDYETAKSIISKAAEVGINLIDTAEVYGNGLSEEFVGRALKELGLRDQFVIATKIPGQFLSYGDVFKATKRSLERLGVDSIDLMQVHWPPCWHNIPTCEYMRALEKLVDMGLIKYIGVSNFAPELLESARACLAKEDIVSNQVRYNLIERDAEKEIIPYAEQEGLSIIAWSPLAQGILTGKYTLDNLPQFKDVRADNPLFHPDNFRKLYTTIVEQLINLSKAYGKTPAQIALKWLIQSSETVIVIPGAKNPEQVEANAVAAEQWELKVDDWLLLEEASRKVEISRVVW